MGVGRFRFGRRDGPGILVYPNGTIQKVNKFKTNN